MIVEFTVGNFLSFKDNQTLSMVGASVVKEFEKDENASIENVFYSPNETKLLKSSVLYGANGSGKSNFLNGFRFFRNFILESYHNEPDTTIETMPFLLSTETENKPSFFELVFFVSGIRYRYGFEVDKEKVCSEWLFSLGSTRETTHFIRQYQEIEIKKFKEGAKSKKATRKEVLFLSKVAQDNGELALQLRNWFKNDLRILSGLKDEATGFTIGKFLHEPKFKQQLVEFFKAIQIGSDDIEIIEKDKLVENQDKLLNALLSDKFPPNIISELQEVLGALQKVREKMQSFETDKKEKKSVAIRFKHKKLDAENSFVEETIIQMGLQSKGTQKIFNLFGLWVDAIENGKVLLIDEFDSSLHTLLAQELIKMFHTQANKNGQVIFVAHDTNLLKKEIFRRDQIWFAEKNAKTGATDLYSLIEYKDVFVRNDASFEKGYLEGKYGAIPYLGNIQQFINDFIHV